MSPIMGQKGGWKAETPSCLGHGRLRLTWPRALGRIRPSSRWGNSTRRSLVNRRAS